MCANNLCMLELFLGDLSGAISSAELTVTYANRYGSGPGPLMARSIHANALHQSGRRDEAESIFREAEQMQAES